MTGIGRLSGGEISIRSGLPSTCLDPEGRGWRPVRVLELSASAMTAGEFGTRRLGGSIGSFTKTLGSGRGLSGALGFDRDVPGLGGF